MQVNVLDRAQSLERDERTTERTNVKGTEIFARPFRRLRRKTHLRAYFCLYNVIMILAGISFPNPTFAQPMLFRGSVRRASCASCANFNLISCVYVTVRFNTKAGVQP